MPRLTPRSDRALYSRLRDFTRSRAEAARKAGISVSTARAIDAAEHRCGRCGRPLDHKEAA